MQQEKDGTEFEIVASLLLFIASTGNVGLVALTT